VRWWPWWANIFIFSPSSCLYFSYLIPIVFLFFFFFFFEKCTTADASVNSYANNKHSDRAGPDRIHIHIKSYTTRKVVFWRNTLDQQTKYTEFPDGFQNKGARKRPNEITITFSPIYTRVSHLFSDRSITPKALGEQSRWQAPFRKKTKNRAEF